MASVGIAELLLLFLVGLGPAAMLGLWLLFADASPAPRAPPTPPAIEAPAYVDAPICARAPSRAPREG
jgi:hypothetical protein